MNSRRKSLLVALVVLLGLLFIAPIGTVELVIWLVLLGVWAYGFFFWARTPDATGSA